MRCITHAWTLLAVAATALPAAAQQRRASRPSAPLPTSAVTPDGRIWERIQLRYIDVRAVAAVLQGAPVVPSDFDLWQQSMARLGGGGFGGYGSYGGYAGYGGPMGGGFGGGYGYGNGLNGAGGYGVSGANNGAYGRSGGRFIVDPNSNSAIVGRGRRVGQQGPLLPNVPFIVDPNTNALIVDP